MTTVENHPVPTTVLPITTVDGAIVAAPPQTPAVDALDPHVEEDQRPDSTTTQLPADDDATSPPEVTRLPPDQLDIVADTLFEAKKLMDTTGPAIANDGGNGSKAKEQEDAATIHAKDSTADTNISDATTVVAEHETEDTLKDDVRNDTQYEGVGATLTEETPIGSVASHDTVTEVNPGAEEAPPTAEISTSESEPAAGSVPKDDPIVSTAEGNETPIMGPGPNEAVQPEADETSNLPEVTPTTDSVQLNDGQTSPGIDEVNSIDNTDHKTEIEEEPTGAEDQVVVSPQEVDDEGQVAGITIEAPEGEQTEVEQPSPAVRIEGAENGSVRAPIHDSLNVEENSIAVEIVAPTPALAEDLDLEASDAEGAMIQSEDFSVPGATAGEELGFTSTVTPHPEPEVDVSLTTVEDRTVVQEEVGEGGVVVDALVVEAPCNAEDDVPTPTAAVIPVEVIDGPHDSKEATEAKETSPEIVSVVEEKPKVDTSAAETAAVANLTLETSAETVKDEPAAEEAAPTPVPDEQPVELPTPEAHAEAVPVPETSAEEVPDTDKSVIAPEFEIPVVEETPVVEEIAPTEESVEPKEVEEQREVAVEATPNAEEPPVENIQAIEEPVVEVVPETQEVEAQVLGEGVTESVEEQTAAIEPSVPEVPTAQEESKPAALDEDAPSARKATEQVPVPEESATDNVDFEEAEPAISEEPAKVSAPEPLAAEEIVEEVNASEGAVVEEPAEGEVAGEELITEPAVLNEAVPAASLAESPEPAATCGVVEEATAEKGESAMTNEGVSNPEPVLEALAFSQPEIAVEGPIVEEKATDEPTLEDPVPVEENPTGGPVAETVTEDKAVEEAIVADAVVQPVGEEPAEVPDVEIPTPFEEPASLPTESVVEEESAAELPAASDELSVQEGFAAEEKSFEEGVYAEEEELQIPVSEEPVNPEVPCPNAVESADVDKRATEIDALGETADPVPVEKRAPSDVVESSGEPSLDDSLVENGIPAGGTITETVAVPEVIVEGEKDSDVFDEFVVKDTPVAEVEAVEGTVNPERPTLDIPEDTPHAERPKSPWTPSFQVTTIGQGASLPPDEDIPVLSPNNDVEEAKDVPLAQPAIIVEPTEASADEVQAPAEQTGEPESTSLSWTPSYSVHSQGSPSPTHASLEPETHAVDNTQSEVPSTNGESAVVPEETIITADKETEPSMDTEIIEPQPVTEEGPKTDHPQITDDSEPPHEPQTMAFVVPAVEEPETRIEAPAQEEGQDKGSVPPHATAVKETFVEDPSSLTPPTEQDRPASPSWVPSYSVSRQGSPLPQQSSLPIIDAYIPEPELASDPTPARDGVVSNDESVQEDILFAPPTVAVNDTQPEGVKKDALIEEDRPSTPWTPSYSVTHQGTDITKETQIESLTPPDQPKEPEPQLRRSLSEEMEGSSAFSPTALIGAGVAGDAAVLAASATFGGSKDTQYDRDTKLKRSENTSEEPTRATLEEENSLHYDKELKRWVNKVTLPTSLHRSKNEPAANGKAETLSEPLQDKIFPTVEIPGDATNLNTTLLPPLDENNALDTTTPLSPESSPILSRKRLESTTSSRLFPGGWFSNTSQIPDERTSLEVAEGVFSGVKQGTTVEDTLPSPAVDPITPVREHSSSDKRRWCIIM